MTFHDKTQASLERRLFRLYENERELQQHENYPCISDIPGYIANQEMIDEIESELADRSCFGISDAF